jgi:integrase
VPLSTHAIEILTQIPRNLDGRVFPVTHEVVSQAFNRARKQAGVKDIRFHDLRHTAITRLAEKLPNLIELSAVSGHKSLAMLKRYYHPNPELLAEKLG